MKNIIRHTKKINKFLNKISSLILLSFFYIAFIGLAKIIHVIFIKRKLSDKTHWKPAKKIDKKDLISAY